MNLVIVESPTKAKTLTKFLGEGYTVKASMGHVRDLPKSVLGVDVEHGFKPEYVMVAGREATMSELNKLGKQAKAIILATDPDREGEAIAYHVKAALGGKAKYSRIVFHEITKTAVEEALGHPGKINLKLVEAQQARRVLDRLVGYKLSPLLWRKVRRGLSAGRVQSVAVRLVVEREKEIAKFKAQEYWEIRVQVSKGGAFWLDLVGIEVHDGKTAAEVVGVLEKAIYIVSGVKKTLVRRSPPPPFMTSTLQRAAANLFSWSSKKTMQVAQRLYERGYITYHRTDSFNLASEALGQAQKYILSEFGEAYGLAAPRRYRSKSRLAQEAHEAIRPTEVGRTQIGEDEKDHRDLQKLYQMVWRRFVATQMTEAVYDRTTIDVKAGKYGLRAVGSVMKFDGWLKLYGQRDGEVGQILPQVKVKDKLVKKQVNQEQKFTEPPPRFNEASLIKALEERGIGRPSTYAPIISTIQSRQYVEKKEQRFYATSVGVAVTEFLGKYFPKIMDYEFTAGMEDSLDKIAAGEKEWNKVMQTFYGPFAKEVKQVEKTAKRVKVAVEKTGEKCPTCTKGEVVIRVGRFGKFLSCSRFPECKYTAAFIEKLEGIKCPEDGGEIVLRRTRKGGKTFYGCANYPKCKWASWRKPK